MQEKLTKHWCSWYTGKIKLSDGEEKGEEQEENFETRRKDSSWSPSALNRQLTLEYVQEAKIMTN